MQEKKYNYILIGKIIPEYSALSSKFNVSFTNSVIDLTDGEYVFTDINIKLENSLIIAECKCTYQIQNRDGFMSEIKSLLHSFIDASGYESGRAYDIDVITCLDYQNKPFNFWGEPLKGKCSPKKRSYTSKEIVEKLYGIPDYSETLKLCFANIREAIRFPHDTGYFCYRSIENIRQYFVKIYALDDKKRSESWEKMWTILNITGSDRDLSKITKYSESARHGEGTKLSAKERSECFEKAYFVIDKFIEYALAERMNRQ